MKEIRRIYFEGLLYKLLYMFIVIVSMGIGALLKSNTFIWIVGIAGVGIVIFFIYLICLLNRYFLGESICSIDEKGIYVKDKLLPFEKIKYVTYIKDWFPRHSLGTAYLKIFTRDDKTPHCIEFPFYAYRMIKKISPKLIIKIDNRRIIFFQVAFIFLDIMFFIFGLLI